jgi:hypothetical protein
MFNLNVAPRRNSCTQCASETSPPELYRCYSCAGTSLKCRACLITSHSLLPLHRAALWTGTFWDDRSLTDLGLVVHLGHSGSSCTHVLECEPSKLYVGDINGFTTLRVCYLPSHKFTKGEQLLQFGFFPCSNKSPQSAFTLSVLEFFSLLSTLAKTSVHKFYSVLERLTNTGFPDSTSNRYRELSLTHRKYEHLMTIRRSGRTYPPHPNASWEDQAALTCMACPQPGVNFQPQELNDSER